jgi:hypothetical protein
MLSWLAIIMVLNEGSTGASVAWSTLIGALVGGGLSLTGTVLVERHRGKAAASAVDRQRRMEGRLAARLIVAELQDAQSVLRVALQRGSYSWPPSNGFQFEMGAWGAHSAALAATVPDRHWESVAAPYSAYRYANLLEQLNKDAAETLLAATENAIDLLDDWVDSIKEAL